MFNDSFFNHFFLLYISIMENSVSFPPSVVTVSRALIFSTVSKPSQFILSHIDSLCLNIPVFIFVDNFQFLISTHYT